VKIPESTTGSSRPISCTAAIHAGTPGGGSSTRSLRRAGNRPSFLQGDPGGELIGDQRVKDPRTPTEHDSQETVRVTFAEKAPESRDLPD
jgi:hypothetical protein